MPRPSIKFDLDIAERVEILTAAGMAETEIAIVANISRPTLRRVYREELKFGRVRRRAEILIGIFNKATTGSPAAARAFLELTAAPDPAPLADSNADPRKVKSYAT